MKKYILILLLTGAGYGQTLQNPTFGNTTTNTLKIKTPATVTSVNFLSTVETDGSIAKIAPVNLPFVNLTTNQTAYGNKTFIGTTTLNKSLVMTVIEPPSAPTVATSGAGVLTGSYMYAVSFYTSDGKESGGQNPSTILVTSSNSVQLTGLSISPNPLVIGRKIYRTDPALGDLRAMKLVATIANNVTTGYLDNTPDASLGALNKWYNTTGGEIYLNNNRVFSLHGQSLAIGENISQNNTGYANHIVGNSAGVNITSGYRNTFQSLYAGYSLTTGYRNTATGVHSLNYNTIGHNNSPYGYASAMSNTIGSAITAIGDSSFTENLTGSNLIGLGAFSGRWEMGSNKLYISTFQFSSNADEISKSIIYGEMNTNTAVQNIRFNGRTGINTAPDATSMLKVNGTVIADPGILSTHVVVKSQLDLVDTNALHKSGNEIKTGRLEMLNTGATSINYISVRNDGTTGSEALSVINSSSGLGINATNIATSTSTLVNLSASTGSTGAILDIRRQGVVISRFDTNGLLRTPPPTFTNIPTTSGGAYVFLTQNTGTGQVESIPSANVALVESPSFTGNPTAPTPTAGDNDTSVATTAFVQSAARPYKAITGNFTQTGSAAPAMTVFENTTGETPTVAYNTTGIFSITFVQTLATNKTFHMISVNNDTHYATSVLQTGATPKSVFFSMKRHSDNTYVDGVITTAPFEIRIYN